MLAFTITFDGLEVARFPNFAASETERERGIVMCQVEL